VIFEPEEYPVRHASPYHNDNLIHNLRIERYYKPQLIGTAAVRIFPTLSSLQLLTRRRLPS